MSLKADNIFVNLPVEDLKKSVEFFSKVGFEFDANMTDDNATCMIINKNIYVMLLVKDYFKTFTKKEISDTKNSAEVILALSADSKEKVDEIVNKALEAGGKESYEPVDHGFMYVWSFQDIDGHQWEIMFYDETGATQN